MLVEELSVGSRSSVPVAGNREGLSTSQRTAGSVDEDQWGIDLP
jgi:hypothetical protein